MENPNNSGSHSNTASDVPWYLQPRYHRYWTHYAHMRAWYDACHHMQKTFHDALSNSWQQHAYHQYYMNQWMTHYYHHHQRPGAPPTSCFGPDSSGWCNPDNNGCGHYPQVGGYRSNTKQYVTDQSDVDHQDNGLSETQYEDDDDYVYGDDGEFEVELSEEMRSFFLQSQKHRQELKEMKEALNKREELKEGRKTGEETMEVDEFVMQFPGSKKSKKKHITGAPTEQPGKRRAEEMKVLYGRDSPAIHGMETAIQMQFDRNCDKKKPSLWPTVALKM